MKWIEMCKKDLGFFVDSRLRLLSCRKGNYLSMLSNIGYGGLW